MKAKNTGAMVILLGLLAVSCRQDPIFFIIASETAPKKPRIEGAPTNMVVVNRNYPDPTDEDPDNQKSVSILYVASGRLHWYAKATAVETTGADEPRWDLKEYSIPQPKGKIISLAATDKYLYVLCLPGSGISSTLMRISIEQAIPWEWKDITPPADYSLIQSIHADPETTHLFAGARNSRNAAMYALLSLDDDTETPKILKEETAILSGAVCREEDGENIYYLSTRGGGIFQIAEIDLTANTDSIQQLVDNSDIGENNKRNNRMFMGMIKLENGDIGDIIAIERKDGYLYKVQKDSFARINYTSENNTNGMATGKYATGALALWKKIDPESGIAVEKLLIAGIQGGLYSTAISSYTHGYVEFVLNPDGSLNTAELRRDPGKLLSLVDGNQDRYTATIGKHPINHLFQAPSVIDNNTTFFASTQTNGLWSYRYRPDNKGWQWNAED